MWRELLLFSHPQGTPEDPSKERSIRMQPFKTPSVLPGAMGYVCNPAMFDVSKNMGQGGNQWQLQWESQWVVTSSHSAMVPMDLHSPGQTTALPRLSSNANKPHLSLDGTRSDVTLKATSANKTY